jgi:hypothetical protein
VFYADVAEASQVTQTDRSKAPASAMRDNCGSNPEVPCGSNTGALMARGLRGTDGVGGLFSGVRMPGQQLAASDVYRRSAAMTVLLINALRAAETLASFHQERADTMPPGAVQDHHQDMARRCLADLDDIRGNILAASVTVEHQADAVRRRDLEVAHRIIDRHPIMHGVGMPSDDVPAARTAMARDIADAFAEARGGCRRESGGTPSGAPPR